MKVVELKRLSRTRCTLGFLAPPMCATSIGLPENTSMHKSPRVLSSMFVAVAIAASSNAQGVGVRKISQLIGDYDFTLKTATMTQTTTLASIGGTDLGSSFEHRGRLYFLFGDTLCDWFTTQNNRDTFVYTTSTDPWNVTFAFPFASSNHFKPIFVPNTSTGLGALCVPSGGISYSDVIYMVYTNQWFDPNMERSYMCRSDDDGQTWLNRYTLSVVGPNHSMANSHFINVSMSIVGSGVPSLYPYPGQDNLVMFGSGAYRQSALYLAVMPATSIDAKPTLRYFAGLNGITPQWSTLESAAVSVKSVGGTDIATNIGEFSAQFIPQLGKWVVLTGYSRVKISLADQPWGPYSTPVTLWDGWDNDGHGNFMHVPSNALPPMDSFGGTPHDAHPWAPDRAGGGYGPYLIPRYTTGSPSNCQLYFTLSTWNPYRLVLMRAQWPIPQDPPTTNSRVLHPGDVAWATTPGVWFTSFRRKNTFTQVTEPWISTHDDLGDNNPNDDVGVMWCWLPRNDKNKTLSFFYHGGDQEVLLLEGSMPGPPLIGNIATTYNSLKAGVYGRVVECAFGPGANNIDRMAEWDLRPLERGNLKVVIIDHESQNGPSAFNFVSVGPMTLTYFQ